MLASMARAKRDRASCTARVEGTERRDASRVQTAANRRVKASSVISGSTASVRQRGSVSSRWKDVSALMVASPSLRRASASAAASGGPFRCHARARTLKNSRSARSASAICAGKRWFSERCHRKKVPASASAPPMSVLTMRTGASVQSPLPSSASSTKVSVAKMVYSP
ncbi:hypothetical protein COEX109129_34345 [Corallococcus exiguus]